MFKCNMISYIHELHCSHAHSTDGNAQPVVASSFKFFLIILLFLSLSQISFLFAAGEVLEGVYAAPQNKEESRKNVEQVLQFISSRHIRMPHISARGTSQKIHCFLSLHMFLIFCHCWSYIIFRISYWPYSCKHINITCLHCDKYILLNMHQGNCNHVCDNFISLHIMCNHKKMSNSVHVQVIAEEHMFPFCPQTSSMVIWNP